MLDKFLFSNKQIPEMYFGNIPVAQVYFGNTLVWEKAIALQNSGQILLGMLSSMPKNLERDL